MSKTLAPRKQYTTSQKLANSDSYQESAVHTVGYPAQNESSYIKRKPRPQDDQDRDNGYPQTEAKAQRRPGATGTGDTSTRTLSMDPSSLGDREQGEASVRAGGPSTNGKDKHDGRRRLRRKAEPRREKDHNYRELSYRNRPVKTSAGSVEDYDHDSMLLDGNDTTPESYIQSPHQRIHFLQQEKDVQMNTIADLQNQLQFEAERCKKIKESANQMAYAMERKDLYVGQQDSDDTIYSQFQALIGQIRTWSLPFAQDCPSSQPEFPTEVIDEFGKVAPGVTDFSRFLQTPKNLRLFVRGYVGMTIADSLFRTLPSGTHAGSCDEDVWMDKELAHGVCSVEDRLFNADRKSVTLREFHDWRALTTTLISKSDDTSSKTNKSVEAHVTQCRNRIMDVVGNWVATKTRRVLEVRLFAVLLQAVRLSKTLRRQRTYWSFRHPGVIDPQSGLPKTSIFFDEATMDDRHGDEDSDEEGAHAQYGKVVEIFVTPSLFKSGNSDGEQYDVETCVMLSEVKCRIPSTRHRRPVVGRKKVSS